MAEKTISIETIPSAFSNMFVQTFFEFVDKAVFTQELLSAVFQVSYDRNVKVKKTSQISEDHKYYTVFIQPSRGDFPEFEIQIGPLRFKDQTFVAYMVSFGNSKLDESKKKLLKELLLDFMGMKAMPALRACFKNIGPVTEFIPKYGIHGLSE